MGPVDVRWLSGLSDGFVVSGGGVSKLYADGKLSGLDIGVSL